MQSLLRIPLTLLLNACVFWPQLPEVSTVLQMAGLLTYPYPGAFPFLTEQWL